MLPNDHTQERLAARFWRSVRKTEGCWLWTGMCQANGYGRISVAYVKQRTHRVAWELTYGPIPESMSVLHRCDNPPCCRPDHLFLGTLSDNMQDALRKGRRRNRQGASNSQAKLTPEQVREIRARYRYRCNGGAARLAAEFGVSPTTVVMITSGKSWTNLL